MSGENLLWRELLVHERFKRIPLENYTGLSSGGVQINPTFCTHNDYYYAFSPLFSFLTYKSKH